MGRLCNSRRFCLISPLSVSVYVDRSLRPIPCRLVPFIRLIQAPGCECALITPRFKDPAAALALVSARPPSSKNDSDEKDEEDKDLKRAKDLVELHYEVKEKSRRGESARGLGEARAAVWRAVGM